MGVGFWGAINGENQMDKKVENEMEAGVVWQDYVIICLCLLRNQGMEEKLETTS